MLFLSNVILQQSFIKYIFPALARDTWVTIFCLFLSTSNSRHTSGQSYKFSTIVKLWAILQPAQLQSRKLRSQYIGNGRRACCWCNTKNNPCESNKLPMVGALCTILSILCICKFIVVNQGHSMLARLTTSLGTGDVKRLMRL